MGARVWFAQCHFIVKKRYFAGIQYFLSLLIDTLRLLSVQYWIPLVMKRRSEYFFTNQEIQSSSTTGACFTGEVQFPREALIGMSSAFTYRRYSMTAAPTQHAWSSEALFSKALLYVAEMERYTADDWQFGLWASLNLELIARACLSHISPTLLADGKEWRNIHHALGHPPTSLKFKPTSADISKALSILHEIVPEFTKELSDSCGKLCSLRNAELHSGEEAFAGLGTSSWLPQYYASCRVLLESMGKNLGDLFDDPKTAEDLITSLKDTAAKAVQQDIKAHKEIWEGKSSEEQAASLAQATSWASRHVGHRTKCPACDSPSLIHGSSHGPVTTDIGDDMVVQRQTKDAVFV